MMHLKPLPGTELSEYVISLLRKHNLCTVRQFLDGDIHKLSRATNLFVTKVVEIKKQLRSCYGPQKVRLSHQLKLNTIAYHTGIESLDKMLGEGAINTSSVWEICSLPGIGKTQFVYTIAINFVSEYQHEVLFIATKGDCIGTRMERMLLHRNVPKKAIVWSMHQIIVERAFFPKDVNNILEQLIMQLECGNVEVSAIRLIIIDSLPAMWFLFSTYADNLEGKCLLIKFTHLIYKLASKHSIPCILVNLLIPVKNPPKHIALHCINDETVNVELKEELIPALGRHWSRMPKIRLSLQMDEYNMDGTSRIIKVIKSCYSPTGESCSVRITEGGVV